MTETAVRRPNTRARILEAALALFLARGFDGTTISDIERAVGLAAGTGSFYRHFKSKDDVFVAAVQGSATEYMEHFLTVLQELDAIELAPTSTVRGWPRMPIVLP
jgi:AcrR family transcriptional regulator